MQVFTKNLTEQITLEKADNVYNINLKAQGGTVGVIGNGYFRGWANDEIELAEGDTFPLSANPGSTIVGVTIIPRTGVAVLQIFI